jgi:hypothetical protein
MALPNRRVDEGKRVMKRCSEKCDLCRKMGNAKIPKKKAKENNEPKG